MRNLAPLSRPVLRTALLALTASLIVAPAHASARVDASFAGVVSEDAFAGTPEYRASVFSRANDLGVGTVRQTLDWSVVEPRRGQFDWAMYDAYVGDAAKAGIRVLPLVFNAPSWATKRPKKGAKRGTYPPKSNAQFAGFAATAAKRYGPKGSFWTSHPEIPRTPVTSWQIWNEPNLPVYWQPKPSAKQYVALLRATSKAIKKVDRKAEILTGGLPKSRLGIPLNTFVRQMYSAGGKSAFDTLAVNPYSRTAGGVVGFLRGVRTIMNQRGDRSGKLWATELGWSDKGPKGAFRLGADGQAKAIRTVIPALWKARSSLKLQGFVYFNWRDAEPYPGGKDFWGLHTGLLSIGGTPKPAYNAFRDAVAGLK